MLKDKLTEASAWAGFKTGKWSKRIDVREFIQLNYTLFEGSDECLAPATDATQKLWAQVMELTKEERDCGGMWDMDTKVVSSITSHDAGCLDKELETIVGVQTEKPFKCSMQSYGGIRMAKAACESYGYE